MTHRLYLLIIESGKDRTTDCAAVPWGCRALAPPRRRLPSPANSHHLPEESVMPNPLISLLLLLGGADRPNEALRPQRHPAGERASAAVSPSAPAVPRRSVRSECSSRSRSTSTLAPPRCWQAATRSARSRSGSCCSACGARCPACASPWPPSRSARRRTPRPPRSTSPPSSGWAPGPPESSPTATRCSSWPARSCSAASASHAGAPPRSHSP